MPIIVADQFVEGPPAPRYVGRVARVLRYVADRNHSDTLDYNDIRSTNVVEALVYIAGGAEGFMPDGYDTGALHWNPYTHDQRPIEVQRFARIDCTNLFVWRGENHRTPVVDDETTWPIGMKEDLAVNDAWHAEQDRKRAEAQAWNEEVRRRRRAKAERDRPKKGMRMVAVRGRKVPPGTVGTVAFVADDAKVLLKPDDGWQRRDVDGVWVDPRNLEAWRPCEDPDHYDCRASAEMAAACASEFFYTESEEVNCVDNALVTSFVPVRLRVRPVEAAKKKAR